MLKQKEYVPIIKKRTGESKKIINLVLKEYVNICIKLMLNQELILFPKNFGSGEIVSKPWTESTLKKAKGLIQNYEFRNRTNFKIHNNAKNEMIIYGNGKLSKLIKHVSINNLKKFRYVDK